LGYLATVFELHML